MATLAQTLTYAKEELIPLSVMVEVSHNCNLACEHCYNGESSFADEMSLDEFAAIFKELAAAGGLFMTLTGGEPLLHPRIFEIIEAARENGFAVRLFSNGTLIDERIAEKLALLGVYEVGISVYGARAGTHDAVTLEPGSFFRAIGGIKAVVAHGIDAIAKFTFMNNNVDEFDDVRRLAANLRANFTYGYFMATRTNGSTEPLKHRLSRADLKSLQDNSYLYPPHVRERQKALRVTENLLERSLCRAGFDSCAVKPNGDLHPCIFLPRVGNLLDSDFQELWRQTPWLDLYRHLKVKNIEQCRHCQLLPGCQRCSGLAGLENHNYFGPQDFACVVAEVESEALLESKEGVEKPV